MLTVHTNPSYKADEQTHFPAEKKMKLFFILAIGLISILCLPIPIKAATFTVTKTADTNDGVCDTDCSLREAVAAANTAPDDDVIAFDPGIFNVPQTITLTSLTLSITGNGTTINGPGANLLTISIANPDRAFNITGNNTAISNLRINGGGIIVANPGSLNLSNSTIENISNFNIGGAVYNNGGTLQVQNANFNNNQAGLGGGIYNQGGTTTVTSSILDNNRASDFLGAGGVYNGRDGVINFTASTISNNMATNAIAIGGGISNFGIFNLIDSTVSGNVSQRDGGGIYNQAESGFPNAGVMTITNSTFYLNTAGRNGGGIYQANSGGTITLLNNTIVSNIADSDNNGSGSGGGISVNGGTAAFRNTIIANNTAPSGPDISGSLNSQGFNLIKNTSGGSISGTTTGNITGQDPQLLPFGNYGGLTNTLALQITSPALDRADPNNFPPTDQRGVSRPLDGDGNGSSIPDIGSVESQLNRFTVTKIADTNDGTCDTDCSLREAISATNSGNNGLITFEPTVFATQQTITLTLGELVLSNQGMLIINGTGRNLLTISGNNQSRIFTISSVTSATVNDLSITGGNGVGSASTGFGGGIFINAGTLLLNNTSVANNSASGNGGGIFNALGTLTITNSSVANNNSNSGGGISNSGTLTLTRVTISSNTAVFGGGGIVNSNSMTMTNSTVSGNSTNGSFGGGGIFHSAGTSNLVYSTIVSNTGNPGGGINNNGGTINVRSTLIGNNAGNGGEASDFFGTLTSQGFNLIETLSGTTITGTTTGNVTGQDPILGTLADNGGSTLTHLLLAGSPAIDKADSGNFPTTDQRGISRPRDGDNNGSALPDIGAVEIVSPPLTPQTFVVDRTDDTTVSTCTSAPNDCTLRGAISRANSVGSNDTIDFDGAVFGSAQTITLNGTNLQISNSGSLTINGTGATLLTISGNNASRVFSIFTGADATINRLTIANGNGSGGDGGGIANDGTLRLNNASVINNSTTIGAGGGVFNGGAMVVINSTVSNNTTTLGAGGLYNFGTNAQLTLTNSTVSGNTAPLDGGIGNFNTLTLQSVTVTNNSMTTNDANYSGGVSTSATVNIRNTIIAGNLSAGGSPDVRGTFFTLGYNLVGNTTGSSGFNPASNDILNPPGGALLAQLGNNGGPTQTHALLENSPAIDKGKSFGLTTDQRGFHRPFDNLSIPNAPDADGADIGAFEKDAVSPVTAPFDYDGDGKTDISIFRPAPGEWWYLRSSDGGNRAFQFGASSDKITPADFTGDGKTDIAFWRPSTGEWFILRSENGSYYSFPFGTVGDIPFVGDFDADGKADAGVFRPSTVTWYIQKSTGGTIIQQFGAAGDKPVVGDYDGDGKADIAIFRPNGGIGAEWWIQRSSDSSVIAATFGASTDKAVQGDYTGDGKTDIAIWRPSNGNWFILRSEDFSFYGFPFGTSGDVPAPGDYDGDGRFDAGIFRPSDLNWYIQRSTAGTLIQQFGIAGDLPTPNAFVP